MAVKKRRMKRKEDHSEPAPKSLAGLPTELLAIVVSMLATKRDIFSLACVSRRLNDVAMARWLGPPERVSQTIQHILRCCQYCLPSYHPARAKLTNTGPTAVFLICRPSPMRRYQTSYPVNGPYIWPTLRKRIPGIL